MIKKVARILAIIALVCTAILVIASADPASKDYISYWSAGQLLTQHSDPYSYPKILEIEKSQNYTPEKPIIMRNPPWALFLVAPLGWMTASHGLVLWTALLFGCIFTSFHLLQIPPKDRLLGYLFAPVFGCFSSGQSSPFLLLGFSLFLCFHRRRPFIAGLALLLMAIKPHLFLVFWPLLLVDSIYRRNFRLLAGSGIALTAAVAFAVHQDPHIWTHYFAMLHSASLGTEFLQTPSYLFRYIVAPRATVLQLFPAFLGILWSGWFYARHRHHWNWRLHGTQMMFVSVLVSPYAWMTDDIVLLPGILFTISNPNKAKYADTTLMVISGIAMLLLFAQIQLSSGAYLWTSTAWFAWFLYSQPREINANHHAPITTDLGEPADP